MTQPVLSTIVDERTPPHRARAATPSPAARKRCGRPGSGVGGPEAARAARKRRGRPARPRRPAPPGPPGSCTWCRRLVRSAPSGGGRNRTIAAPGGGVDVNLGQFLFRRDGNCPRSARTDAAGRRPGFGCRPAAFRSPLRGKCQLFQCWATRSAACCSHWA
ncbi:hypothetical protein D7223_30770 [Micromonospora endolithica]|uniref:Uncharacterized protein n=1 Tax=Micromonospora endolithica TaxID=230091 RepID=A0A3A9YQV7_9ACTN|nr:hypothetical protein D7223_30770 [Micromonospora endolithica]